MIIPYLTELLEMFVPEAVSEVLGLRVATVESLASGMFKPTTELMKEIKSFYGMANFQRLKELGVPADQANRDRYTLQLHKEDTYTEVLELITRIAQKEGVDPNLIRYGLTRSRKSWEELKDNYAEVPLDMDFFDQVKNEIFYI